MNKINHIDNYILPIIGNPTPGYIQENLKIIMYYKRTISKIYLMIYKFKKEINKNMEKNNVNINS